MLVVTELVTVAERDVRGALAVVAARADRAAPDFADDETALRDNPRVVDCDADAAARLDVTVVAAVRLGTLVAIAARDVTAGVVTAERVTTFCGVAVRDETDGATTALRWTLDVVVAVRAVVVSDADGRVTVVDVVPRVAELPLRTAANAPVVHISVHARNAIILLILLYI